MSQILDYFDSNILSLTGDINGPVGFDANDNIDIFGGNAITVTGTPVSHSLTIDLDPDVAASFLADDGNNAIPAGNVLTVSGGDNIYTTAAGSTLTVSVNNTTDHAVQVGNSSGSLSSLPVGGDDTVLIGNASANPSFSDSPTLVGLTISGLSQGVVQANSSGVLSSSDGTDGQLLIASSSTTPAWANLASADGTVTITNGSNSIDLSAPSGALTSVTAGTNLNDSGTAIDPILNLDTSISGIDDITFNTGGAVQTNSSLSDTLNLRAYNTSTSSYKSFATFTAGNPPTCDLDTDVTIDGSYIYRVGGTDVGVTDGGTGTGSFTAHAVLLGNGTSAINQVASLGTANQVLTSNGAGSDPTWQDTVQSVTAGTNLSNSSTATDPTIDLNASISGIDDITFNTGGAVQTNTSLSDTLNLRAYNTSTSSYKSFATFTAGNPPTCDLDTDVTINGSYIYRAGGTDVGVTDGGTGASTLTDGGILLGSGTSAITATAQPTDGQLLIGSSSSDPGLATLTEGTGIDVANGSSSITVSSTGTSINAQTGTSYTFVLNDAGKIVTFENSSAITATVPPNSSVAYSVGTMIGLIQKGAGALTIAAGSGVTINSNDSNTSINGQYAQALLIKYATDSWFLTGQLA